MIQIHALTYNMIQEQTYIVSNSEGLCAIVDPGCQNEAESQHLDRYIESLNLKPIAIWLTHLHLDHIFGAGRAAKRWQLPIYAGTNDRYLIDLAAPMAEGWGLPAPDAFEVTNWLTDGDSVVLGSDTFRAIEVPGHTAGSIVYYSPDAKVCLSGDVLFRFSVGRSDLPGGNGHQLISGISTKLLTLEPDVRVFPGHGPATTIGDEQRSNPYLMML